MTLASPLPSTADIVSRLRPEDVFGPLEFKRAAGRLRSACPLHGGDNPTTLSIDPETFLWKCHAGCGEGSAATWLEKTRGLARPEAWATLRRMAGFPEPEAYNSASADRATRRPRNPQHTPSPIVAQIIRDEQRAAQGLPPLLEIEPAGPAPVRDLAPRLGEGIGRLTPAALALLQRRLPGLDTLEIGLAAEAGLWANPARATDHNEPDGIFHLGRRKRELVTLLYSVDEPDKIASAQLRWTGGEDDPLPDGAPKTRSLTGSPGGSWGVTFGRIDRALERAGPRGTLIICEGDLDTATLYSIGAENSAGVPGAGRAAMLVRYLVEVARFEGRVVLALDRDPAGELGIKAALKALDELGQAADAIELCDGRPAVEGQDLNDVFRAAGGDGDGARAVMALIEQAPVIRPRGSWAMRHAAELQQQAKQRAAEQAAREAEQAAQQAHQQELTDACREIHAAREREQDEQQQRNYRRFVKHFAQLLPDVDDATLEQLLTVLALWWRLGYKALDRLAEAVDKASAKPKQRTQRALKRVRERLNSKAALGSKPPSLLWLSRALLQQLGGRYLMLADELAAATHTRRPEVYHELELLRSTHHEDRAFCVLMAAEGADAGRDRLAHRLLRIASDESGCGAVDRSDQLRDTGEEVRRRRSVCEDACCAGCVGYHVQTQTTYFDHVESVCPAKLLKAFVSVEEPTRAAFTATYRRTKERLFRAGCVGALAFQGWHCPELGVRLGWLFVAEDTESNRAAFAAAFGELGADFQAATKRDALTGPGGVASVLLSRSFNLRRSILSRDPALLDLPELAVYGDRTARHFGRAPFTWRAMRDWKQFLKALRGELGQTDERPQDHVYIHNESGIEIHRHGCEERPLHLHELRKVAEGCPQLMAWSEGDRSKRLPTEQQQRLAQLKNAERMSQRRRWTSAIRGDSSADDYADYSGAGPETTPGRGSVRRGWVADFGYGDTT